MKGVRMNDDKNINPFESDSTEEMVNQSITFNEFVPFDDVMDTSFIDQEKIKFPTEAFGAEFESFIKNIAEAKSVDEAIVATFLLGVFSLCISGEYEVEIDSTWIEPANLYLLVVAPPSQKKSPVMNLVMAPIKEEMQSFNKSNAVKIQDYQDKLDFLINRKEKLKKQSSNSEDFESANTTFEALSNVNSQILQMTEHPIRKLELITTNATSEAVAKRLKENDEIYAVVSDEPTTFQVMNGLYSNGVPNIDIYLQSWSGSYSKTDRVSSKPIELFNPLLTICVACQPDAFKEYLQNKKMLGRGMLQRFLITIVPPKEKNFYPPEINQLFYEKFGGLIKGNLGTYKERRCQGNAPERTIVPLDPEAREKWIKWQMENAKMCSDASDMFQQAIIKLEATCVRIALILWFFTGASKEKKCIPVGTMEDAIKVSNYFREMDVHVYTSSTLTQSASLYIWETMVKCIQDKQDIQDGVYLKMNKSDLYQNHCKRKFKKAERSNYNKGLFELEKHGYIRVVSEGVGGQASKKIYVNPVALRYEKEKADQVS